jgi:predicted DNA-binding WGR domain protein
VRRWELVAGSSAKFWEIGQDGVTVTVRFGRLGTAGQTQTKELPSAQAAEAHVAKLVAEKEKKGYRPADASTGAVTDAVTAGEGQAAAARSAQKPTAAPLAANEHQTTADEHTTTPRPTPKPAPVDEDTWVMPKAWLRDVVRQRGFHPAPEFSVDQQLAEQARQLVTEKAEVIERALADPVSDQELVRAARDHLAGQPDPVGAAAIAAITASGLPSVHAWVADHGPAFAAVAAVEFTGLEFDEVWHARRNKQTGAHLHHRRGYFHAGRTDVEGQMLIAVRYALAVAGDEQRAAAEAALAELSATPEVKQLRSFLMPSRADWFAEVCALSHRASWWLLPCSAGSYDDFVKVDLSLPSSPFVLYTALYVLGPAIAPLLAEELDREYQGADSRKLVLKVLAALPTDEAFTIMLDRLGTKYVHPALMSAMAAFPARAARLLAKRVSSGDEIRQLLKAHLLSNPAIEVPAEAAAVLAEAQAQAVPEAGADQLPPLLVSPPWLHRRPPVKPVVLNDLPVPGPAVVWQPGEREAWLESGNEWYWADRDWKELLEDYHAGRIGYRDNDLFLIAPESAVRHLLAEWTPSYAYGFEDWGKRIAARFGIDALPALLRLAAATPGTGGRVLLPFVTAEVATVMADWFARTKQPRRWGLEWLARHRDQAARLLIPAAAGAPGVSRRSAEAAIRHLHGLGVDVAGIAASCGAQAAIEAVLAVDPLDVLPVKLPVIGEWADTRLLPQVLLRDRRHALPAEAAGHLLMTAALSKPGEIYAGLPIAREALDRTSLAEFAWAVFEQWQKAGAPSKESWALNALGWFGDDSTVRALSPLVRAWPGESQHARAVAGLDVLADIGTEVALSHLNSIAEKVPFKGLKTRAQEKVTQIAAELGLSRDQLSDRLVPRLGLDDAATLVIDYGPRQFTVGFDEQLKPYVLDQDGKRRKDLPKPAAKDDQDKAPLEHKRFAALKKDVRTIAADQIRRLERAMVDQRTWSAEEFRTILVAHPLLWHLVRRLVWITGEGLAFRLAEDRTPANADDDEITLPEDATVRVAHPVDLGNSVAVWGEVFADYEILQPFPQLGRPVHLVPPGEALLGHLKKYCDAPHPIGKVLGLTKKGWVRGEPQDAGVECWMTRPLPGGGALVVSLDPGIAVGAVDEFPEVSFPDLWFSPTGTGDWSAPKNAPRTFDADAITLSEVLSELESLQS